jgi:Protein of unknown function (DUF4235)
MPECCLTRRRTSSVVPAGSRGSLRGVKFIYKPFGLTMGILSGVLAKKLFEAIWGIFDKEEPPKPTTQETTWPKVLAAAAVQGITFKVVRATVDRSGAKGFNWLTGIWPGDKRPEKSQAAEAVR